MGLKYLWDTNIVIYFLQNQLSKQAEDILDEILNDSEPTISTITEIELLCWKTNSKKDILIINKFIEETEVFELEKNIKLRTANIRKHHRIKLPDAIIAATAIENNFTLITRNTRDFKSIDHIKILNPFEII